MSTPTTAEEKTKKKNNVKARGLLLMALPNEHRLTFCQYPDAKSMFAAIETRFGVVWMNKPEVKTMSIDDLYNNFKIVEQKVKKTVGTSSGGQNLAFMTALSSSSTNDANTACSQVSAASPSDLEQIHEDDLKAMDLKWQLSLLSVRAKKYLPGRTEHQEEGRSVQKSRQPGTQGNNEDTSSQAMTQKLNQTEFIAATYNRGLAIVEAQLITYRKNKVLFSEEVAVLKREASKDLYQLLGSQITEKSKKGLGYSVVPPPHPLIYNRPKKFDLSYSGLDEFKEIEFKGYGPENKEQSSQDTSSFVESSLNVDK
ncbi:hypothetical protein Tco_1086597 [Tanacetum coccineum]